MDNAHEKVHLLNPNNEWKRLQTLTYKWMETLTKENLKTREKSAGRKITISNI